MSKIFLKNDPNIYTVDNFLSPDECSHFINISKNKLKRSLVAGKDKGFVSKGRSGENCWISHTHDHITKEIANKISSFVGYPLENAENFQIIHYTKSQEYRNHYDAWKFDGSDKSARCLLRGGQRMITALVYLNDVISGGDTRFTKLNINVQPRMGRLLVFENCIQGSNIVHKMSEHAGTPVVEGEKYAFNLWFRQQSKNKNYIHNYNN